MGKKIAVLLNPTSGQGKGGQAATQLAERLRDSGMEAAFLVGTSADEALNLTRQAVADGVDAVVAATKRHFRLVLRWRARRITPPCGELAARLRDLW